MCLSTSPSNDSKREKMLENGKWNLSCLTSHRVRHSSAVADRNKSCRSCCVSQSAFSPLSLLHYNRRKLLNISFLSFYCVRSPSLLVFLISTIIWIIAQDRRLEGRGSSAPQFTRTDRLPQCKLTSFKCVFIGLFSHRYNRRERKNRAAAGRERGLGQEQEIKFARMSHSTRQSHNHRTQWGRRPAADHHYHSDQAKVRISLRN